MKIEMELWHLITLLVAFITACWAVGLVFFGQFEKRLGERFTAQATVAAGAHDALREAMNQHMAKESRVLDMVTGLEREFLNWKADLPNLYVRREDYIRNQTIIEHKLDYIVKNMGAAQERAKK